MSDREYRGSQDDPLDDIDFEEFELREPAGWEDEDHRQPYESSAYLLACPSCGVEQNSTNRHCEQCGARLGQRRIAVASPPLRSVNAGGRALGVIVVVIALVVVAALVISAVRNGGDDVEGADTVVTDSTVTTSTVTTLQAVDAHEPFSITCSSEYNATLGCDNLIDGVEDYWNDGSLRGEDAWIVATFDYPISFKRVLLVNVDNEEKFRRNYRVRVMEIEANDIPGVPFRGDIPNANDRPHPVRVETSATTELRIEIKATWPSEAVDGGQAFDELAVQELEFWGHRVGNGLLERDQGQPSG